MEALSQLRAAADAGMRPRFSDLTEAQKDALTETLVPRNRLFLPEESALFAAYALELEPAAVATVETFNASASVLAPILRQSNGTPVLPSHLLTWCGQGDGFHALQSLLWAAPIVPFNPPQPPEEFP